MLPGPMVSPLRHRLVPDGKPVWKILFDDRKKREVQRQEI